MTRIGLTLPVLMSRSNSVYVRPSQIINSKTRLVVKN